MTPSLVGDAVDFLSQLYIIHLFNTKVNTE